MSAQVSLEQYLIFSTETNSEIEAGKNALRNFYRNQSIHAEIVRPSELAKEILKNIKGNLIVSIVGHFHGQADSKEQAIYETSKSAIYFKEFADLIENKWKLPKEKIKELRLAACYTDKFALDLANELGQRGYRNLIVTGYKGELNVSHGVNGGMVAGLSLDKTTDPQLYKNKYDKGHDYYENGWEIDLTAFKKNVNLQIKYAAEKFAVRANTTPDLQAYLTEGFQNIRPAAATSIQKSSAAATPIGSSSLAHEDPASAIQELNRSFSHLQLSGSSSHPSADPPKNPPSSNLLFNYQQTLHKHSADKDSEESLSSSNVSKAEVEPVSRHSSNP